MRCSEAREALSAWYDGEPVDADAPTVAAHVAECRRCTAFQDALGALAEALDEAPVPAGPTPALGRRRSAATPRSWFGHPLTVLALRVGVGLAGGFALVLAVWEVVAPGVHADHEAHESLSFTLGVCVALVFAALRPRLARAYLPVIGTASLILLLTSALDVGDGRIGFVHEYRHVAVLVGTVLVVLLCLERPDALDGAPALRASPSRRHATLRVVTRAALAPAVAGSALVAALLLVAAPASAHAVLEQSNPEPDALLKQAPTTVELRYDEAVTLLPISLRVYGPDGSRADDGNVGHAGGNAATVSVGLKGDLARGTYLVSWRVISADSHPVSGAYTFSYGKRSQAPTASEVANNPLVGTLLDVSRWVGYLGSALGLGGAAFLCWCWPAGWKSLRARDLVAWGGVALGVGALAALMLKGPYDAGLGVSRMGNGVLLREVLGSTFGRAQLARVGLAVLVVALALAAGRLPRRVFGVLLSLLAVAVGITFAASGHAAAGGDRWLRMSSDTAHVLAMSAWLGGLVLLLTTVLARGAEVEGGVTAPVLRFSRVAATCTAILVVTGTYQAWRQVASWGGLFHTRYGTELLVKLALVALALLAAAGSRLWVWRTVHPTVDVHAATETIEPLAERSGPSPARLRRTVGFETLAIVGVLAVTSLLVTTEPAATAYHPSVAQNLTVGPDTVQVSAVPKGDRQMQVHLYVFGPDSRPSEPKQIEASVSLPGQSIGPLPLTLVPAGRGHRQALVEVPVPGDWQLAVTVRTSQIDEATGYVTLPIR